MAQNIYILTDSRTRPLANRIDSQIAVNGIYESNRLILDESTLLRMASACKVEYFYVISTSREMEFFPNAFKFKPPEWDNIYVHIWNNDPAIRLFNTQAVLENPGAFTDESLNRGEVRLKNINEKIFDYSKFDIVFLSYDEFTADENFEKLKRRFPRIKRINGVKGIMEAHKAAAKIVSTSMFYVVDADAEILPEFNFNNCPDNINIDTVYVWHSKNPVNGLEYGYGGVKLFPTQEVLQYNGLPIDFTTSVANNLCVIGNVANITHFDTDPFSTWRSAFRECVKLSSKIIDGQLDEETETRLNIWCSVGNGEFGDFSIAGANEGMEFGKAHYNQPEMLRLINDFDWLEKKFNS